MTTTDFQEALLSSFISELYEFTNELDNDIVLLEAAPEDDELINKIFRAYHSIKSSAGIVGYKSISDFTHIIETVLERIRKDEFRINEKITTGLLDSNDILRNFLEAIQTGISSNERDLLSKEVKQKIDKVKDIFSCYYDGEEKKISLKENELKAAELPDSNIDANKYYDIYFKPSSTFFQTGNEPLLYIKDLTGIGKILFSAINTEYLPVFTDLDAHSCYLSWNIVLSSKLNEIDIKNLFLFIIDDNDIHINEVDLSGLELVEKELDSLIIETLKTTKKSFLSEIRNDLISKYAVFSSISTIDEIDSSNTSDNKNHENENDNDNSSPDQKPAHKIEKIDYVKVDIRKLDELLNLIGELVINYSQVETHIIQKKQGDLDQGILATMDTFQRLTKEIQEKVMKVRMLPVGPLFNQFYRYVRDIAQQVNKKVKLQIIGSDTELDKTVIEKISDPLRHLVRNAIDHGIEKSEDRIKLEKPEEGTIILSAFHREGRIFIEIEDDGQGINPEKVLNKAIALNLIKEEESANLTEDEIINFIFRPGFSTSDTITDLSGRGVGMDVVKNNIEQLRGSIYLDSKTGIGTKMQIVLPLTLSIIEAMIIRVADLLFVINIMSVVEIFQPELNAINPVEEKAELVNVRGEFLPLIRLYKEFKLNTGVTNPSEGIIVIVESEKKKYCLMADELAAQQQVVIKSMDQLLNNGYGITGTTILGDGKIAFILDIPSLINFLISRS